MMKPSFNEVKEIMRTKELVFFSKPMSINIIGIRDNESTNEFNDTMCVLFYDKKNVPRIYHFPCTTKAGSHWLLNPMRKAGTAILKEGQYRGLYKLGVHNRSRPSRSYKALEQKENAQYYRDGNKDSKHNYNGVVYVGNYKTNIHRAGKSGWSKFVDKWSAGCQVITGIYENKQTNWDKFLSLCEESIKLYGNSFTYTLLNRNDFT